MSSLQQSSLVFFLLTITFFFLDSPVLCAKTKTLIDHISKVDHPTNETLIDRICHDKNVEDDEFCHKIFHNHITCPSADIHGLTKFTIRRTFSTANYVYSNILNLLQYKTDRSTKKDLQKCIAGYNVVILEFDLATQLVEKHEYKDAFDAVRETVLALEKCKVDIKIPRHPKSPFFEANKHTRTLIAISLASLKLALQSN